MKRLFLIFFLLFLNSVPAYPFDLTRVAIDLSHHNSTFVVDNVLRRRELIELIFHRATLGTYQQASDFDQLFAQRAREADEFGFMFGAYHLPFPSSDGTRQARGFIRQVRRNCVDGQPVLLALDWEPASDRHGNANYVDAAWVSQFAEEVKRLTGEDVVIYTNRQILSRYRTQLATDYRHLRQLPLWFAQYHRAYSVGDESRLAHIFPHATDMAPWSDWDFWQFSGGEGITPTKSTSPRIRDELVDQNFFNGTRPQFRTFFEENSWICEAL